MTTITYPSNLVYDDDVDCEYEGDNALALLQAMMMMMMMMMRMRMLSLPFEAQVVGETSGEPLLILVPAHLVFWCHYLWGRGCFHISNSSRPSRSATHIELRDTSKSIERDSSGSLCI